MNVTNDKQKHINRGNNAFAIYIAAGRIISMLAGFAMPIFLTRFLSKGDYGLYSQFYTILNFCGAILALGMQSNLFYFYPTADEKKKKTLLGNTLGVLFFCGLLALVLLEIPFINKFVIANEEFNAYIHILAICVCFYVPTRIIAPLFVIRKDKFASIIFPSTEILLKLVIVIASACIFKNLESIFLSIVIVQFLLLFFVCWYAMKKIDNVPAPLFDISLLKEQIVYALPFGFSVLLNTFARQFDKIVCISYLSAEDYAIYALAFFGIPGISQIYDSVCEVNLVNMTKAYQAGDLSSMHYQYKIFSVKMLSFSVPIILIVFLFSGEIISFLFTDKYLPSVPFFRIYILSFIIGMLGAGIVLRAMGKTRYSLRAYVYSSVFSIPLTYLFIMKYGIWGAIITAMISLILPKLFQIYFERKILSVGIAQYMLWKSFFYIIIISLLCLFPIVIIHHFFVMNIWVCFVFSFIYIICVYLIEIKYDLFIIDKNVIYEKINRKISI